MPDAEWPLDASEIRRRLAGTQMPQDPLDVDFTHIGTRMPENVVEALRPKLRPAGVLVPIIERGQALSVLLTERSEELKHHAGQVSFPGGGMESHDVDIAATALRETHEEVGIHPSEVDIAGYLEPTATITGFAVTTVIGFVQPTFQLTPDPTEVSHAFEVPLEFLMDHDNAEYSEREFGGSMVPVVSFQFGEHTIWGATAGIIISLSRVLQKC
jgi:8-oxo-dGTP pyrophosphatase MutT (NUDIX family)